MTEVTAHHGLFKDTNLHVDDTGGGGGGGAPPPPAPPIGVEHRNTPSNRAHGTHEY
ncbi:hypothetical protein ABIB26_004578, partial [Arthrobacter sp. UYEF20]